MQQECVIIPLLLRGIVQSVEHQSPKLGVVGSSPPAPANKKGTFVYQTKVPFLNDVCLRQMMLASPNDVRFANDVCLTAHWGKHRITRGMQWSNIIFAKQMHHIAARRCII